MSSRSVRILLLLGAFGVVLAAGFVLVSSERALSARKIAHASFDVRARAVATSLARLGSAQQAYVAEGQDGSHWMAQANEHLAAVDRGLQEMAGQAGADETRTAVQAAAASLERFRSLDSRARTHVQNDQQLIASDVIFTESARPLGEAAAHVAAAADHERADADAAMSSLRSRQLYAALGAAAVLLLVVLLLVPVPEGEVDVLTAMKALTESAPLRPQAAPASKPRLEPAAFHEEGSSARLLPKTPGPQPAAAARPEATTASAMTASPAPLSPTSSPPPALPSVNLAEASRLCAELARVVDAGGVTSILARAADVLDARGMIVWVADTPGTALYPTFAHGYPAAVLLRLGSLPADADNATAAAWRTGEAVTIEGNTDAPGALVTPIVTSQGCVGVLAAELQHGAESREEIRALATIFAAQLATVVTPVDAVNESALADRVAT